MPIAGFIVNAVPERQDETLAHLEGLEGAEVHGVDADGNIIVVAEAETSEALDSLVHGLQKDERILSVGLAYLNAEDEIEKILRGELRPEIPFGRKKKRP